jgi:hypothetical protein
LASPWVAAPTVYVHAVGACAHDAAEASGTELEVFVEALYKVGRVFGFDHGFYGCACFGIVVVGKPKGCFGFYFLEKFSLVFHNMGLCGFGLYCHITL